MKFKDFKNKINENKSINIDWDDFTNKLDEKFGSSHFEEDGSDPKNFWLIDVMVKDIVEFTKDYIKSNV